MIAEDIINGEEALTPEVLDKLKISDLKRVAKELFEIEDTKSFTKDELLYKMKEMLTEFQLDEDRKTVENFVRSMDNQEKAVRNALNIRTAFDRNWFSLEELVQAYKVSIVKNISKIEDEKDKIDAEREFVTNPPTIQSVLGEISTLSLFGLVKKKILGKGKNAKTKYKIVMTVVVRALERKKKEDKLKQENDKTAAEITAG